MKISVSDIKLVERCERCFWLLTKGVKQPMVFPSVLNAMDKLVKRDVATKVSMGKTLGRWDPGTELVGLDKRLETIYSCINKNIHVVGVLDELLKVPGGYKVVDYKTSAKSYENGRANFWYGVQISAYAFLCEENGYTPVVGGELVFYSPKTIVSESAEFDVVPVPVTVDIQHVKDLLDRAYEISVMSTPPAPSPQCDYCKFAGEWR